VLDSFHFSSHLPEDSWFGRPFERFPSSGELSDKTSIIVFGIRVTIFICTHKVPWVLSAPYRARRNREADFALTIIAQQCGLTFASCAWFGGNTIIRILFVQFPYPWYFPLLRWKRLRLPYRRYGTYNLPQNGGSSRESHADWLDVGGKELCRRVVSGIPRSRGGFALALTTLAALLRPLPPRRIRASLLFTFFIGRGEAR